MPARMLKGNVMASAAVSESVGFASCSVRRTEGTVQQRHDNAKGHQKRPH